MVKANIAVKSKYLVGSITNSKLKVSIVLIMLHTYTVMEVVWNVES